LLVVDSSNQHILNPKALQILNSANILALSLPSHASHILQVHDLSVWPFKKILQVKYEPIYERKWPEVKLGNLPRILDEPWAMANNMNVKKGFQKAGLWP